MPKATSTELHREMMMTQPTIGGALNLIPLILTFSHPGEGTRVRHVIALVKLGTQESHWIPVCS